MTNLVGNLLLFGTSICVLLALPMFVGSFLRPKLPTPEKDAIYECGEPAIGSSYIQFDLRFYVVALLFIVFDVEVAFFFPWAAIYGGASQLADTRLSDEVRYELSARLLDKNPAAMTPPRRAFFSYHRSWRSNRGMWGGWGGSGIWAGFVSLRN